MRTVIQCSPWSILRNIQEEANQWFDPSRNSEDETSQKCEPRGCDSRVKEGVFQTKSPSVDIRELNDHFVIAADLPGVDPKDIEISIENNLLTLKGEKKTINLQEGENFTCKERFIGTFSRRFTLPEGVNADQIEAKSKLGVLEITLPKKPEASPKKVEVKVVEVS